jgi:hypothetical protein
LNHDPEERTNLIGNPKFEPEKSRLQKRLEEFFARYADPKYDLWRGGISKARRVTKNVPDDSQRAR